jgi:hypothetical protein
MTMMGKGWFFLGLGCVAVAANALVLRHLGDFWNGFLYGLAAVSFAAAIFLLVRSTRRDS